MTDYERGFEEGYAAGLDYGIQLGIQGGWSEAIAAWERHIKQLEGENGYIDQRLLQLLNLLTTQRILQRVEELIDPEN